MAGYGDADSVAATKSSRAFSGFRRLVDSLGPHMARRALFIVNLTAGAGLAARSFEGIRPRLASQGIEATIRETRAAGHAVDLARAAAESGAFEVIVAAGGDGTAREVASGVLGSAAPTTPVALLPLGTGNDLAHVAGIGGLSTALAAIASGDVRPLDAIEVTCEIAGRPQRTHAMSFAAVGLAAGSNASMVSVWPTSFQLPRTCGLDSNLPSQWNCGACCRSSSLSEN